MRRLRRSQQRLALDAEASMTGSTQGARDAYRIRSTSQLPHQAPNNAPVLSASEQQREQGRTRQSSRIICEAADNDLAEIEASRMKCSLSATNRYYTH